MSERRVVAKIAHELEGMLNTPLHKACEMDILLAENGQSEISFKVNDFTSNMIGTLHGGIIYAMMDVGCFTAMGSLLPLDRHGVTIDIQVSVVRPALKGETVYVRGRVDRIGKTISNLRSEAYAVGSDGKERLIATSTVLKSMMDLPKPL